MLVSPPLSGVSVTGRRQQDRLASRFSSASIYVGQSFRIAARDHFTTAARRASLPVLSRAIAHSLPVVSTKARRAAWRDLVLSDRPLVVEKRSLHFALRAPVETTGNGICASLLALRED